MSVKREWIKKKNTFANLFVIISHHSSYLSLALLEYFSNFPYPSLSLFFSLPVHRNKVGGIGGDFIGLLKQKITFLLSFSLKMGLLLHSSSFFIPLQWFLRLFDDNERRKRKVLVCFSAQVFIGIHDVPVELECNKKCHFQHLICNEICAI